MSPSYVNLFMDVLEQRMLLSYKHKPLIYFGYIDDIFMIWTDGEDSLNDFLTHCKNHNKHIQFEQTISSTSIPFLDVSVTLELGKLTTDLYTNLPIFVYKSTDKHQYLHRTSCHPNTLNEPTLLPGLTSPPKLFIIKPLPTTYHRSEKTPYPKRIQQKTTHNAIKKASLVTSEEALADKTTPKSLQRLPFVITYNPMLPNIPKILHDSQSILHASERCTKVFKNVPLVSYKRARKLSDMLCSKHIAPPESSNSNPAPVHQANSGILHPTQTSVLNAV